MFWFSFAALVEHDTSRKGKTLLKSDLICLMECFPNLSDLCLLSIWERAQQKVLERGGQFRNTWKVLGWTLCVSHSKWSQQRTAQGLLWRVLGAAFGTRHRPVVSCGVPQHLTEFLPKPVGSKMKTSFPPMKGSRAAPCSSSATIATSIQTNRKKLSIGDFQDGCTQFQVISAIPKHQLGWFLGHFFRHLL